MSGPQANPSEEKRIEQRSRITIMDGDVITFATSFSERDGIFGKLHDPEGPFSVSASRNAVIVHKAELTSAQDLADFVKAVELARDTALRLSYDGRGNFHE